MLGWATVTTSFHGAGEHAAHEVTLEAQEHGERDDDRGHGPGGDDPEVGRQSPFLVVDEQRDRHVGVRSQYDQRNQQVVPGPYELEDRQRSGGRDANRGHDPREQRPLSRPVDAAGFDQVLRDPLEEIAHQEDAKGQAKGDVENDYAWYRPVRVPTRPLAHVVETFDDGQDRHLQRHDQEPDDGQ